jgi:hypothetical protein
MRVRRGRACGAPRGGVKGEVFVGGCGPGAPEKALNHKGTRRNTKESTTEGAEDEPKNRGTKKIGAIECVRPLTRSYRRWFTSFRRADHCSRDSLVPL